MQPHEIEAWVLSIVDRVRSKQRVEDSRVELKSRWPVDYAKAARRLAGHCNTARGEPVLWVIGLDEDRGVIGADRTELREWLHQLERWFESLVPELVRDLNVPVDDKAVIALLFATDRAPFVVKNPAHGQSGGGPVETEVPWRDATAVRSARREDLIRLLTPIQRLPAVKVLDGMLQCRQKDPTDKKAGFEWTLVLELYVVATSPGDVIIPFHQCCVRLSVEPYIETVSLDDPRIGPLTQHTPKGFIKLSKTVDASPTEVLIRRAGLAVLRATRVTDPVDDLVFQKRARYSASIRPIDADGSVSLAGDLLVPPRQSPSGAEVVEWKSAE